MVLQECAVVLVRHALVQLLLVQALVLAFRAVPSFQLVSEQLHRVPESSLEPSVVAIEHSDLQDEVLP